MTETVDASAEDKQAVVYLSGEFSSAALNVGEGYTIAELADALRAKSIFVKTNQAY